VFRSKLKLNTWPKRRWKDGITKVSEVNNASMLTEFASFCIESVAVFCNEVMNFQIP
jgi:hypothetical protein